MGSEMVLPPLSSEQSTREEAMSPGFVPIFNTAPFECTSHPALNVPCGMSDGLPIGMVLIGRHWDEATVYRAADAFERTEDWKKRETCEKSPCAGPIDSVR